MPKFVHDCQRCKYHGHMQPYDIYTCRDSTILRFGDDGPEYESLPNELVSRVALRDSKWSEVLKIIYDKG